MCHKVRHSYEDLPVGAEVSIEFQIIADLTVP